MMKRFLVIGVLLALSFAAKATSPSVQTYGTRNLVSLADSAKAYKVLLENTPIEPQFTLAPRFAVVGQQGRFYFSMGARLRFVATFDWGNPMANPVQMNLKDLQPANRGNQTLFQMSAGTSKLYFNIIGFPSSDNQIGLFISMNLDAESDNTYRISAGDIYMRYRGFLCGYTSSLYDDRSADAYMIDNMGPSATGGHGSVQVNYQHSFAKYFSAGIGIERPIVGLTRAVPVGVKIDESKWKVNQHMPDIPLYFQFQWGKKAVNHLRLSAVFRDIYYYNFSKDTPNDIFGYGIKLSGKGEIGPVAISGMFQGGRAISNYIGGFRNCNLDLVPANDYDDVGRLEPTHSIGLVAALQYTIIPQVFTTVQCSWLRNFIKEYDINATTAFPDLPRSGFYVSANVVWRISDLFSTGFEYAHIKKITMGEDVLHNNRMYAMFMMNF